MKKTIMVLLSVCMFASLSAQQYEEDIVIEQGSSIINVYYGPMLIKGLYKSVADPGGNSFEYKTLGPIGLVYEYLVHEELGIGVELGYSNLTITYNESIVTDPITKREETYEQKYIFSITRAQVRLNYHFVEDKRLDVYSLLSLGYKGVTATYKTTDPTGGDAFTYRSLIPIGIKPGVGFRMFFSKNVGINMELALGTPVICGGISLKFK